MREGMLAEDPEKVKARNRRYRQSHKEQRNEYNRAWAKANPDKVSTWRKAYAAAKKETLLIQDAEWAANNPEAVTRKRLRHLYNITVEDYNALLDKQGGVCAICGNPETAADSKNPGSTKRLAVDHCHTTNTIRGLLCSRCNMSLGLMRDDPARLRSAVEYLERHQQ